MSVQDNATLSSLEGQMIPHDSTSHVSRYQRSIELVLGIPFTQGNKIEALKNGDQIFSAMLEAIDQAERSIEFLTYIYWSGDIARNFGNALIRAAKRGVEVRVLLDAFGGMWIENDLLRSMQNAGVELEWFRPKAQWQVWRATHRTHRKVMICDGRIAFTGGVGIADQWGGDAREPGEWRETHFRIQGPAVASIHAAFISNWMETGKSIRPFVERDVKIETPGTASAMVLRSAASYGWGDMATLFRAILAMAEKRLRISTAYFVPDQQATDLLVECAKRGVEIDIIIPGKHIDVRVSKIAADAALEPLLDAGIRVWHYERTMFHAKIYIIDDTFCCIGSPNFNFRSMREDDEVGVLVEEEKLISELISHFEDDLSDSRRVSPSDWADRTLLQRAKEKSITFLRWGL